MHLISLPDQLVSVRFSHVWNQYFRSPELKDAYLSDIGNILLVLTGPDSILVADLSRTVSQTVLRLVSKGTKTDLGLVHDKKKTGWSVTIRPKLIADLCLCVTATHFFPSQSRVVLPFL